MPRYLFTGTHEEVFPTIVTATGTLVCRPAHDDDDGVAVPATVVVLDVDPNHPRLVLEASPAADSDVSAVPAAVGGPEPVEAVPQEPRTDTPAPSGAGTGSDAGNGHTGPDPAGIAVPAVPDTAQEG